MGNNVKLDEVPIEDIFNLYEEPIKRIRLSEGSLVYEVEINSTSSKVTVYSDVGSKESITEAMIKPYIVIEGKEYPVNYIGLSAFKDCINLRRVEIQDGIEKIFACAFAETAINEIYLPKSLKYLGFGAFSGCSKLRKVSLPESCEINGDPFAGCNKDLMVETY